MPKTSSSSCVGPHGFGPSASPGASFVIFGFWSDWQRNSTGENRPCPARPNAFSYIFGSTPDIHVSTLVGTFMYALVHFRGRLRGSSFVVLFSVSPLTGVIHAPLGGGGWRVKQARRGALVNSIRKQLLGSVKTSSSTLRLHVETPQNSLQNFRSAEMPTMALVCI